MLAPPEKQEGPRPPTGEVPAEVLVENSACRKNAEVSRAVDKETGDDTQRLKKKGDALKKRAAASPRPHESPRLGLCKKRKECMTAYTLSRADKEVASIPQNSDAEEKSYQGFQRTG